MSSVTPRQIHSLTLEISSLKPFEAKLKATPDQPDHSLHSDFTIVEA